MNRDHGSRLIANRTAVQLAAALVALALAALALMLYQPAAHADSASVTMSSGSAGTVTITTGDSVTFNAPSSVKGVTLYSGMDLSGPGASGVKVKPGTGFSITFSGAGTAGYTWKCSCVGLKPPSGSAAIQVNDPPPPPPPATSSTPVDQGSSSNPVDGQSSGAATSGAPTSGVSESTGAASSGTSKPSGTSTAAGGGGGITIGPVPVIQTHDSIPIGFNGPGADPNEATPVIGDAGTGVGTIPSGDAVTLTPSNSASRTSSIIEVAKSTPTKNRPTSLAIVSIAVLAIVSTLYAYRRLGEQATRPGH